MKSNPLIVCFIRGLLILTFISCQEKDWSKNFKETKAVVKEVNKRHLGKGIFKETLVYEYVIDRHTLTNEYKPQRKERAYTSTFSVGDSLILKYRPESKKEVLVVKSIRNKRKK